MSYILEALRRAEAERSAGRPPDVRSVVEASAAPDAADPAHRRKPWAVVAGLALLLALFAAGLWAVLGLRALPVASTPAMPATAHPSASAASAAASAHGPLVDTAREPALPDEPPRLAVPRMAVIETETPPAAPSQGRPAPPGGQRASAPQDRLTVPPARASQAAVSPAAPSASAGVIARDQLPADLRRTLPPISIGGTVYSSDPAQRMLIVDGELWREGDQIRPDLVIEQIRQRDAVLRYRGLRFSVAP